MVRRPRSGSSDRSDRSLYTPKNRDMVPASDLLDGILEGEVKVPSGTKAIPVQAPEKADGSRNVLVNIPRPLSASGEADDRVRIDEFCVRHQLPVWYKEAEQELQRPPPVWPPRIHLVAEPGGPAPTEDVFGELDEEDDGMGRDFAHPGIPEYEDSPRDKGKPVRKIYPYMVLLLFIINVERVAKAKIKEWSTKLHKHFKHTYQIQIKSTISWLSRELGTFGRTLKMHSDQGMELSPARGGGLAIWKENATITPRQRLSIRIRAMFNILELELEKPPEAMTAFLSRLCQPKGFQLYLPKDYLTKQERSKLQWDKRYGGFECTPASNEHMWLAAGFLIPRALLAGLLTSWANYLQRLVDDGNLVAERALRNVRCMGTLIYLAYMKEFELINSPDDLEQLAVATGPPGKLLTFGLDRQMVSDVMKILREFVRRFVEPSKRTSIMQKIMTEPFQAGSHVDRVGGGKVGLRDDDDNDDDDEGDDDDDEEEAGDDRDDAPLVSGRKSFVDVAKDGIRATGRNIGGLAGRARRSIAAVGDAVGGLRRTAARGRRRDPDDDSDDDRP